MKQLQDKRNDVFAEAFVKTNSPSTAMRALEPDLKPAYASVKAQRMLKKSDVQAKIQLKLEKMHSKALKKIDELVLSDNEAIASANSWRVVEHLRGKPIARNLNVNATANIEDVLFND